MSGLCLQARDAAVLVVNHTVSGRDGDCGSLKPALGESWKSAPHTRLQLSLGEGGRAHEAEVTLGRGRGARRAYALREEGWRAVG